MIDNQYRLLYLEDVMGNCEIDLNSIALRCGLSNEIDQSEVLHNINELEEFYERENLVEIYNYLLETVSNPEYLVQIVKCSDSYRDGSMLSPIAKLLVRRPDEDSDEAINLRVICAKAIANHKDTSYVTLLLDCMNNKNENYKVRLACADALGKIGDRFAVTPLINLVSDENEKSVYLKESATNALGVIGDLRAVEPLISILDSKHGLFSTFSFLKEKIIEALGKLNVHNDKIFDALRKSLMDESPMVRINAIEALMNSDDYRAEDCIRICLTDPDDEVKKNALIALYNLSDRGILDEVLNDEKYSQFLKDEAQTLIDEYEDEDAE